MKPLEFSGNKNRGYLKEKISELETDCKNKNIRD
jgi:hypothetical protein